MGPPPPARTTRVSRNSLFDVEDTPQERHKKPRRAHNDDFHK